MFIQKNLPAKHTARTLRKFAWLPWQFTNSQVKIVYWLVTVEIDQVYYGGDIGWQTVDVRKAGNKK
jgi:hypothetical protein